MRRECIVGRNKEDKLTKNPTIDLCETGQKIKRIMMRKGLSVRDVQEYLGLTTPQSIYHWMNGRNLPTIDNIYAMSELFRVPVDEMLCGNRKSKYTYTSVLVRKHLLVYYEKLNMRKVA
ncbi:MAG: helix-turn-helix transcriptional regulator [Agathobacter sp.]|nr:helix-turn-helix transcriptional regulator [Agathobacter sp.]